MSWADMLINASFKGTSFECISTDDETGRDVAFYEYPYVDGTDSDDLGRRGRQFSIRAVFWNEFYALLPGFLQLLDESGPGELIHPTYGSFPSVQLLRHRVRQDAERPDFAIVQMEFVEHLDSKPPFSRSIPILQTLQVYAAMVSAWIGAAEDFVGRIDMLRTSLLGGAVGLFSRLSALGDMTAGVIMGFRNTFSGTTITTTSSDYSDDPDAFCADVSAGLEAGLTANRDFSGDRAMSDWSAVMIDANAITALPTQLSLGTAPSMSATGHLAAIPVDPADLGAVDALVTAAVASAVAQTASDLLNEQATTPTLTPAQVEQIADDARDLINQAIAKYRALEGSVAARPVTEPLKTAAGELLDLALAVLNARPPLISRQIPAPCNLHLAAFRWYGDYTRATELLRLNPTVRNPNDILRGDVLNGYAD